MFITLESKFNATLRPARIVRETVDQMLKYGCPYPVRYKKDGYYYFGKMVGCCGFMPELIVKKSKLRPEQIPGLDHLCIATQ